MATKAKQWLDPSKIAEHGQYIFIYANHYNHIVYSLTRAFNNKVALQQLPYLGRATVPTHVRKDHWRPLATVCFPSGSQGLTAYRQLREFRKRHELEWKSEDAKQVLKLPLESHEEGDDNPVHRELKSKEVIKKQEELKEKPSLRSTKARRRSLGLLFSTTQKANCIADLAIVLSLQSQAAKAAAAEEARERAEQDPVVQNARKRLAEVIKLKNEARKQQHIGDEARQKYVDLKKEKLRLVNALAKPHPYSALMGRYHILNDGRPPAKRGFGRLRGRPLPPRMTSDDVRIEWSNVLDAQFASTWPENVQHLELPRSDEPGSRNLPTTELEPPLYRDSDSTADLELENKREANIPEPELRASQSRLDRVLHRLKHGAAQ